MPESKFLVEYNFEKLPSLAIYKGWSGEDLSPQSISPVKVDPQLHYTKKGWGGSPQSTSPAKVVSRQRYTRGRNGGDLYP